MKTIKHYDESGSCMCHPGEGRLRVTSAAQDEFIRNNSLRNQMLTAPQFRAQINATHLYINVL